MRFKSWKASGSRRASALVFGAALLAGSFCSSVAKADAGDVTMPMNIGANVYTYHVASGQSTTVAINPGDASSANSLKFSEFPGIGYFVTDRIRLGMNLQFTELVTPEPGQNLNIFGFLPQVNYKFWGPLTASLVPSFYPIYDGISQFHFALQGVIGAAYPLGKGFTATASLEVPVFFRINAQTNETIGITPILGVTYKL